MSPWVIGGIVVVVLAIILVIVGLRSPKIPTRCTRGWPSSPPASGR